MRNAGSVVPVGQDNVPFAKSATGLGTGGGIGVVSDVGSGWGYVDVQVGKSPSASGSIVIGFAAAPPTLFFSADEALGTLTVTGNATTTVTVSFAGATMVPGRHYKLNYEWATSK